MAQIGECCRRCRIDGPAVWIEAEAVTLTGSEISAGDFKIGRLHAADAGCVFKRLGLAVCRGICAVAAAAPPSQAVV